MHSEMQQSCRACELFAARGEVVMHVIHVFRGAGAALAGNLNAIHKMLHKQASASKSNDKLRTPLHFAAQEVILRMSLQSSVLLKPIRGHAAWNLTVSLLATRRGTRMW